MNPKPIVTDTYDFPTLVGRGYVYVDKTALLHRLISGVDGTCFFLSRPRRFGKSLMLSTLASIFNGEKKLFKGLDIARSKYDWKKYPTIRLDMSAVKARNADEYRDVLCGVVESEARALGVELKSIPHPGRMLDALICKLAADGRQVVVLVDEYDAPIGGLLSNPKLLEDVRILLHDFYITLKIRVANIHFLMMTGVSKFSKLSVFSGLNNLTDLTMRGEYAGLLGYMPEELDRFFAPHMREFAKARKTTPEKVKDLLLDWYDSYRFSPDSEVRVCNPVSVGRALAEKKVASFWSATGNATLIVERLRKAGKVPMELGAVEVSPEKLDVCDVRSLPFATLMYQGGYLTIKDVKPNGRLVLGVPNREIARSLDSGYVSDLLKDSAEDFESIAFEFRDKLESGGADAFVSMLDSVFAMVPHEWKMRNEAEAKRYFLLFMKMAGADIAVESESAKGRADAVLVSAKAVHIFEFKYGKSARAALKQIDENGYAMPYAADRRKVVCIGLNYNARTASFDAPLIVEAINGKVNEPVNEPVNESALLATIRAHPGLRRPQLLKLVRIREATMKRQLASLAADNLIEFRGAPKNGGYYIKA